MANSQIGKSGFSRIREILWPIHRSEHRKLIPMFLIFFLITFDYNILRTTKDTLVVTAASSGAEAIPFIKVWFMFPGSLFLTFLFTRLSNYFRWEKVIYMMTGGFLIYFALFIYFLYPNREVFHLTNSADYLESVLPLGFKGLIASLRNWTFTTFYVMSELWSNIILSLLFWGFANQVTALNEAKRFYAIFGVGGNFSGVLAGQLAVSLSCMDYCSWLPFGKDAWEQTMTIIVTIVIAFGVIALALFRWMNVNVLNDLRHQAEAISQETKKKSKFSFRENILLLLRSKYMLCVAFMMIAYNISINLVEVVWKSQLKELYPNPSDYNLYFSRVSTIIGIAATLASLLVSGNAIRKCGWTFTAMLTPIILLATSMAFFGAFFYIDQLAEIFPYAMIGMSPLAFVVFLGSMQNILSRSAKYTVFDNTKEMALLPLSNESKLKAKAAIDGVCNRMGKSGGSVIHQGLLLVFSTLAVTAPYVAGCLIVIVIAWGYSTYLVGKRFSILTASGRVHFEEEEEEKKEPITNTTEPVLT